MIPPARRRIFLPRLDYFRIVGNPGHWQRARNLMRVRGVSAPICKELRGSFMRAGNSSFPLAGSGDWTPLERRSWRWRVSPASRSYSERRRRMRTLRTSCVSGSRRHYIRNLAIGCFLHFDWKGNNRGLPICWSKIICGPLP
jgi:hypothetical protein